MSGDRPRITVALPTYNGQRHLAEAADAILAQADSDVELLVSDDRSDDASVGIVRERWGDRARVFVNTERLGLAGNWNRCVVLCRTSLIAIVHQDDRLRSGHLEAHRAAFESEPDLAMTVSNTATIDERGRSIPASVIESGGLGDAPQRFEPGRLLLALAASNPLRCSAVSLRVAAHRELGGFDDRWRYVVDWEFWIRLASRFPVRWLGGQPTVEVRWHAGSETQRFRSNTVDLEETERLLERISELLAGSDVSRETSRSLRRAGVRRLARAYLNRAYDGLRIGGDSELALRSLRRALRRDPGVLTVILADPRLAAMLALLRVVPRRAVRWLGPKPSPSDRG